VIGSARQGPQALSLLITDIHILGSSAQCRVVWPAVALSQCCRISEAEYAAKQSPVWIARQGNGHIVAMDGPGDPEVATGDVMFIAEVAPSQTWRHARSARIGCAARSGCDPDEIASVALFLASDSSFVPGGPEFAGRNCSQGLERPPLPIFTTLRRGMPYVPKPFVGGNQAFPVPAIEPDRKIGHPHSHEIEDVEHLPGSLDVLLVAGLMEDDQDSVGQASGIAWSGGLHVILGRDLAD
jgi:hypothetical protein